MLTWLARLWAWILGLFRSDTVVREVPLLVGDGGDTDRVSEVVDLTGAPKTPQHRRKLREWVREPFPATRTLVLAVRCRP